MLMCKREDEHRGVLCVLVVLWEVPLPFRVWERGRGCLGVGGSLGTPGGGSDRSVRVVSGGAPTCSAPCASSQPWAQSNLRFEERWFMC